MLHVPDQNDGCCCFNVIVFEEITTADLTRKAGSNTASPNVCGDTGDQEYNVDDEKFVVHLSRGLANTAARTK